MLATSGRGSLYLAVFLVLWSGCCILLDSQLLWGVYRQTMALRYPQVPGKILVSKITEKPGLNGSNYQVTFEFAYSVAGQRYTSDQCRYGPDWHPVRHVETLPAGADVAVYYNPDNPADACLYAGVDGSDLSWLMFLTVLNTFMVVGWFAVIQDRRQRRQRGWTALAIREDDLRTHIRFGGLPAPLAGMVTAGACSFALLFVVAFGFGGGFRAGLQIMSGFWALIMVVSLAVTAWTARRNRSGVRDMIIDDATNTITLPSGQGRMEPVTIPFEALKTVEIERLTDKERFFPMLIFAAPDGQLRGERLTERADEAQAENLTNWFRQRLRLDARQPALLHSISRTPDAAKLAEYGIHKTEDAGRLLLIWNNRRIRKDNFTLCFFVLFWIVWAPATCFVTLGIFFSDCPLFCAVWCVFGWLGTFAIPYSILLRFRIERIEISRETISHGFKGWLAGKPKIFPLDTVVELRFGRHDDESVPTLSIWQVRFPQEHLLGYWLAPALKEQVFEAIHEFRQANWLPLKMTRYGA